ncbi:MAG: PilZ domain-containing protein [Bradymonadaceae bacterium]
MSDDSTSEGSYSQATVERRSDPRVKLRVSVEIDSVSRHRGRTGDVSVGGIRVMLDSELPVHSVVDVELELPTTQQAIEAYGEIKWKRRRDSEGPGYVYGIEFHNLGDDRDRLRRWLHRHSPELRSDSPNGDT